MHKTIFYFSIFFILFGLSSSEQTIEGQNIVNACTTALMQSVPPVFCWKKGGDVGVIPKGCPSGYRRHGLLCYKNCNNGYFSYGITCVKNCKSGYKYNGISCKKSAFKFYFPKIYFPKSLTNCDKKVPCPAGRYKSGCLCYKNCNAIGLENCGIGSCAINSQTCAESIINIIKDVVEGIADFVSFCVSLGQSTGLSMAKNSAKNGLKKAGENGIKIFAKSIGHIFKEKFKETIKSNAKKAAKKIFEKFADGSIAKEDPNEVCEPVYQYIENKVKNNVASTVVNNIVNTLDIFDVRNIVNNCKKKKKVECVQSCLDTAINFDPTGLLTIARAFVQPSCSIPTTSFQSSLPVNTVKDGCMELYTEVNFEGNKIELCNDFENLVEIINDIKSIKLSDTTSFMFYQDESLSGNHLFFAKASIIKDLVSYLSEEDYKTNMNYALKVKDECANVFFTDKNGINVRYEICEDTQIEIDLNDVTDFEVEMYNDKVSVELFENNNFTGKAVKVNNPVKGVDMKRIGAIKIDVKYNNYGFVCGGGIKEIVRKGDVDIECFSLDGVNCVKNDMEEKECLKFVNDNIFNMKPISCGNAYQYKHNVSGYEIKGHWCQQGLKYFRN
jgi:hypothetical protein